MKKIVSILLAVMMIAAIAVPSFAATITKESDPKTADVQVMTKTTDKENNDPENYTVTFLLRSQLLGTTQQLRTLLTPLILSLSSALSSRFRLLLKMQEK